MCFFLVHTTAGPNPNIGTLWKTIMEHWRHTYSCIPLFWSGLPTGAVTSAQRPQQHQRPTATVKLHQRPVAAVTSGQRPLYFRKHLGATPPTHASNIMSGLRHTVDKAV